MSTCKLSIGQLLRRAFLKTYSGPIAATIGSQFNFTFAISDPVPANHLWVILAASAMFDGAGGGEIPNMGCNLYIVLPNAQLPLPSNTSTYKQWPIFLSHRNGVSNPATTCNGAPVDPSCTVRVDEMITTDQTTPAMSTTPFEQNILRGKRPLLLAEFWRLLAHTAWDGVAGGGALGANVTLKLLIAQLGITEDFEAF